MKYSIFWFLSALLVLIDAVPMPNDDEQPSNLDAAARYKILEIAKKPLVSHDGFSAFVNTQKYSVKVTDPDAWALSADKGTSLTTKMRSGYQSLKISEPKVEHLQHIKNLGNLKDLNL